MTSRRRALLTQAAAGGFDPENDITWHSLFWAEGTEFDAGGNPGDGNAVTTWDNETSERDLVEITTTPGGNVFRPIYRSSDATLNSQPAVDFEFRGVSETVQYSLQTTAAFTSTITQPFTLVWLGYSAAGGAYLCDAANTTNRVILLPSTNWRYFAGSTRTTTTAFTATTPYLIVFYVNGSSSKFLINGTDAYVSSPGTNNLDSVTLGSDLNGGNKQNGSVALYGLYSGDLTANGSYADFNTWVEDHYGLTIA